MVLGVAAPGLCLWGVVCLGYMYLAVYFVIVSGADFSVLWTCVMIHFMFWCGTFLFKNIC